MAVEREQHGERPSRPTDTAAAEAPTYTPSAPMNRDSRANRYFRNAVERHWDPADIDLERDRAALGSSDIWTRGEPTTRDGAPASFSFLRIVLAMFGAGETEVTEDLAPLASVVDDIDDQLFLTTQIYEESKHVEFFDRYWTEVINPVEAEMGIPASDPTADRWYPPGYLAVLGRNGEAMHRLLEADTPENRAIAYCHYHLSVEAIIAQLGYFVLTNGFDGGSDDLPHLPGLMAGIANIRADEGRHVGFGLAKTREFVASGQVDPAVVERTTGALIRTFVSDGRVPEMADGGRIDGIRRLRWWLGTDMGFGVTDLLAHLGSKHLGRMDMIRDAATEIPEADSLTDLETRAIGVRSRLARPRRMVRAVAGI